MFNLFWPLRLHTPYLDLQRSFDELTTVLSRLPDGQLTQSTNDGRRRLECETVGYRCWIEEDPKTGCLHSAGYDDPAGRFWHIGIRRKIHLYLRRHSSGSKWKLLHKQHGYHYMWRNETTGHRAVYGMHGDTILLFADRDTHSYDAATESPTGALTPLSMATNDALAPNVLLELFPSAEGATEGDILRLEETVGCRLPPQYRELLAQANGGAPRLSCYQHGGVTIYLQYVFGIEPPENGEPQGLDWQIEVTGAPITSEQLVPFARGGDADMLFISLRNGTIHYRKSRDARITRIADSLREFLAHLRAEFS